MFSNEASLATSTGGAIDVAEDVEVGADEAASEADVDAKDDPALGGCGSGLIVVSKVSHAPSKSGLKLRSRSPRPSTRGTRDRRLSAELFSEGGKALALGSSLSWMAR